MPLLDVSGRNPSPSSPGQRASRALLAPSQPAQPGPTGQCLLLVGAGSPGSVSPAGPQRLPSAWHLVSRPSINTSGTLDKKGAGALLACPSGPPRAVPLHPSASSPLPSSSDAFASFPALLPPYRVRVRRRFSRCRVPGCRVSRSAAVS